jgi:type IV secretory pathway VirB10-like protein
MKQLRGAATRILTLALMLPVVTFAGCDTGHDAKLQEDMRNLDAVMKDQLDESQWKLDDAVATGIFDESHYLTFRKCHEEPPTHEANKRACVDLRARVAKQEAKVKAQADREKAAW